MTTPFFKGYRPRFYFNIEKPKPKNDFRIHLDEILKKTTICSECGNRFVPDDNFYGCRKCLDKWFFHKTINIFRDR